VKSFTADPGALGDYAPLRAKDGRTFEIERLRQAKNVLVVKFRGVDDRDAAERLNGIELYADRAALPAAEEDEFYHADLIGLDAFTGEGEALGTVIGVHNFGAGDIVEISPPGGTPILAPFTRAAVPHIDLANRRITVIPPAEAEDAAHDPQKEQDST
jgi:16S rRNA processing protein RimM